MGEDEELIGETSVGGVAAEIEADAQLLVETPEELSVPLYQHQKQVCLPPSQSRLPPDLTAFFPFL